MTKKNSPKEMKKQNQLYIKITENGEICVWGLEQNEENTLLHLTGNRKLTNQHKGMSFNLCG